VIITFQIDYPTFSKLCDKNISLRQQRLRFLVVTQNDVAFWDVSLYDQGLFDARLKVASVFFVAYIQNAVPHHHHRHAAFKTDGQVVS
jgi:hypothetical protein